jgi:hypothetical protein
LCICCVFRMVSRDVESVDIMVSTGGIYLRKPDEDRILQEARRNPNELANNPRRLVGSRR